MNKAVLQALLIAVGLGVGGRSARPSLTRVASDRVAPRQIPLDDGFWGASGLLQVVGPDLGSLDDRPGPSGGYRVDVVFNDVLEHDRPDLLARIGDRASRGFLRMVPSLWYGVRPEVADRIVPDGRASCSGSFYRVSPRVPRTPAGWKVVRRRRVKIRLAVRNRFEASGDGGAGFVIDDPKGWCLASIGLTSALPYVADFDAVRSNPLSEWADRRPATRDEAATRFHFRPVVWAEVVRTVLREEKTGGLKEVETPTGWIEAAGRFMRNEGSGRSSG